MTRRTYATDEIEVGWDASLCIHTARCLKAAPEVFDVHRRPWIVPDAGSAEEVIGAVAKCPTGALTVRRIGDVDPAEALPEQPNVMLVPNGPLMIRGKVEIVQPDGTVVRRSSRVTLCRCGASENKPYCDASHRRIGFSTADEAPEPEPLPRVPEAERESPADCG
ncbi:MAG: (4Fe-4S)-binding protein [Actinomycetota bacterium]